jgi:hypothetical protein
MLMLTVADDTIRRTIKQGYNRFLRQSLPTGKVTLPEEAKTADLLSQEHFPQVPRFGFIIRSAVIKAFPGLHMDIKFAPGGENDKRSTICHFTQVNDTTLMCLLDRGPEELPDITMSQPPHQQRFSLGEDILIGAKLDDGRIGGVFENGEGKPIKEFETAVEFDFAQLYTSKAQADKAKGGEWPALGFSYSTTLYDPVTRLFHVKELKTLIQDAMASVLKDRPNPKELYDDTQVTSLPIALELNDPCYYLKLHNNGAIYAAQQIRQLWTRPMPTPPVKPPDTKPSSNLPVAGPPNTHPQVPNPPFLPPPHFQSGAKSSNDLIGVSHGGAVGGTPHLQYTCAIYPDYKDYPKLALDPDFTIPTKNTYLMDLIFSVRRTNAPSQNDTFRLSSIVIDIPLSNGSAEPLLVHPHDGPNPRMLSNLRFTASFNRKDDVLQCVLVPRGKTSIPMTDRKLVDLSFKVANCHIAPIVTPTDVLFPRGSGKTGLPPVKGLGTVHCKYREGYVMTEGAAPLFVDSAVPITVYKADATEDADVKSQ